MVNFTLVISVLHCGGLDSCYINLLSRWDFQQLCSYLISKASETKKMSHLETSLYQRLAQIQYTSMGLFILNRVSREWTWIDLHWHGIAFRECSGTYAECHEGKKEKKKTFFMWFYSWKYTEGQLVMHDSGTMKCCSPTRLISTSPRWKEGKGLQKSNLSVWLHHSVINSAPKMGGLL